MTLQDILKLNQHKSLAELDVQLENARQMAIKSVADGQPKDIVDKYLDAWKLSSDMYFSRKYGVKPE